MGKNRRAFKQEAQGLPINGQAGLGGHPREAPQVAVQAGAVQGFALQAQGGVKDFQFALPVGHVHAEPGGGRAEAHAVFQVPGQERRDMKRLGHGEVLMLTGRQRLGRQHVVIALAPRGVGHFTKDRGQRSVGLEAVEETHRVKGQAPTAGL
eukprot:gene16762-20127_t